MPETDYGDLAQQAREAAALQAYRGVKQPGTLTRMPRSQTDIGSGLVDAMIPRTPLDFALMAAGPLGKIGGKVAGKALATAGITLGDILSGVDEAQAGPSGTIKKMLPAMLKEITGEPGAAQRFHDFLKETKAVHPQSAAVDLHPVKDYEKSRLFLTPEGKSGFAISPDGTLGSVFKHPDAPYAGAGGAIAERAAGAGADRLDAYDLPVLMRSYGGAGFKEVARVPFNPKFAEKGFEQQFAEFSGKTPTFGKKVEDVVVGGPGRPDLVGMAANPPGRTSGVATRSYDDMQTLQRLALEGRHPAEFIPPAKRAVLPDIYGDPRAIVEKARSQVGPEDPLLQQLFNRSRGDLYDMGVARVAEHGLGNAPPPTMKPTKGAISAIEQIDTPANIQRYTDVLGEALKYPELKHGGVGWYVGDPEFERMAQLIGYQNALREYPIKLAFEGSHSPGSDVLTEIQRGTTAYQAYKQGWLADYIKYGAKKKGVPIPPDVAAKLEGVPGHLAHGSQTANLEKYLRGETVDTPKTTPYINASGVPQTGYSWQVPTMDAMMARNLGLADVRTAKTLGEQLSSMSGPELAAAAPMFRKIASNVGLHPVGAQGLGWTAFGPATGVETALGAPKLELKAQQIGRRVKDLEAQGIRKSPEQVRDEGLLGQEHWLLPLIGPAGLAALYAQGSNEQ